jgi:hypothetical protein
METKMKKTFSILGMTVLILSFIFVVIGCDPDNGNGNGNGGGNNATSITITGIPNEYHGNQQAVIYLTSQLSLATSSGGIGGDTNHTRTNTFHPFRTGLVSSVTENITFTFSNTIPFGQYYIVLSLHHSSGTLHEAIFTADTEIDRNNLQKFNVSSATPTINVNQFRQTCLNVCPENCE